jgi:hypothetical protein
MPNSSGMATGHHLGDTGTFSDTVYAGRPVAAAGNSVTPFLESDAVLAEVDADFHGNFLDEESILYAAVRYFDVAGFPGRTVGLDRKQASLP